MIFDKKYSRCAVDAKKIVLKELGNEHILLNDSKAARFPKWNSRLCVRGLF